VTLYLDASALVKRYVAEEGSDLVISSMQEAEAWTICRIGYVETARAISLAAGKPALKRLQRDWPSFDVVEVDHDLAEQAAVLAIATGLRSLDALHLAAALLFQRPRLTLATWDVRLHRAAREAGLRTLPAEL
jgi:hypothetical protein